MANTSRKSAVAHSRNDEAVRRVLVGDDDQGIRDVLARLLEDEGYEIVTASSGAEALERLTRSEDERPHLDDQLKRGHGPHAAAEVAAFCHPLLVRLIQPGEQERGQHSHEAHAEAQDAQGVGSEPPGDQDRGDEAEGTGETGAEEEDDGLPAEIPLVAHGVQ